MQVEFKKTEGGGLGFALIAGTNGSLLRVKEICCGGAAEQDGRLRVGDILLEVTTPHPLCLSGLTAVVHVLILSGVRLQVNGVIVSGLSHSKVVDILRKAEGTVQLTICRDIMPLTYSESPSQPNMSAPTEPVLAAQPSPDPCPSPEVILDNPPERHPGDDLLFSLITLTHLCK